MSQNQAPEVHEDASIQESAHSINEPMQEESQEPIEVLSQQNETDNTVLPDNESAKSEKEDEREKIMPEEIRHKVSSVVPALLKVAEDDQVRCCCCSCNINCTTSCLNTCCMPCNVPFKKRQDGATVRENFTFSTKHCKKEMRQGEQYFKRLFSH